MDYFVEMTTHVPDGTSDFHGAPTRPFDWARTVEKFDWPATPYADHDLRAAIIETVSDLDHLAVSTLIELLTTVNPVHHIEEYR
jgi:2-methylcitrate dehydratase